MKKISHSSVASLVALTLACAPALMAQQTSTPDQSQNSRASDSTADQHAADTGSSASQPGTLDKNNSKDASSETRDPNPGTASTDSAAQSGTKAPSDSSTMAMTDKESSSGNSERPVSDRQFILSAAQGGMTEVELGKLASQNASSSDVKAFGERMVSDHSKADDQLKGIAQQKGVEIPARLDAHHQAMVDRMSKLNGPAFDKAYVKMMVRDHDKVAAQFQTESESGKDPQLKTFAGDTLKTIQSHLDQAKSLQGQMK